MRHQISGRTVVALLVCAVFAYEWSPAAQTKRPSRARTGWTKACRTWTGGKRDVAPLFKKAGAATTNQDK